MIRDIKLRLIDTQEPSSSSSVNNAALGGKAAGVNVGSGGEQAKGGCC
jgi:hypothetical protein